MSSWFDRLLEELQRRQAEADARREGRPFEPRRGAEPRNVTPPPTEVRRRTNGGDRTPPPTGRPPFPTAAGGGGEELPWRRWLLIGGL
ncbi:MAG TPA: hypothetical protein VFV59_08675, partial [Candidatus Limnocylindria bacterium]|nr:hypothetical protein [Candidatus Limnocylindria bacterium]